MPRWTEAGGRTMPTANTHGREILLISRCPPYPLYFGDRLIPYYIVRQLAQRGYQIDLLAFYQQPEDLADIPYYERYFRSVRLVQEPMRSPLSLLARAIFKGRRFPAHKSRSWSPEMWELIESQLHHRRAYDVVQLFGGVHVYEFRDLLRRYPIVHVPYESYTLYLERALARAASPAERLLARLRLMAARRYESWMFNAARRVVVVSDLDARTLRRLNPDLRVAVIPNGVDIEHFVPTGYEPDAPRLLFTGNYAYAPNVDAALSLIRDIFPAVRRAIPEAELVIVGPSPPPQLQELGRRPGVRVTGRVPDVRPYFENAALYVSPLRLGAGIKNKILEAMAMQTAVVATPLSCDGINVTHGKDVILARNASEVRKAAIHLLENHELRARIAAAGRALIEEQYTWRRVADAYEMLYETVIREHASS